MRNTIKIFGIEKEGSSLVTVIIGILFIAAIGTILFDDCKPLFDFSKC